MTVYLNDITKWIFHINHAVRFFAWIVITGLFHTFFATGSDDALYKLLKIRILNTKMKNTCFPVFKIIFGIFLVFELKKLYTDSVSSRQMRYM